LYRQEVELANSVALQMQDRQQSRDQAEQSLLGFDHARLGGLLAQAWGLTPVLQEVIKCHHQPDSADEYLRESQILCLANLFAQPEFEISHFMTEVSQESRGLAETLGIDKNIVPELIENAQQQSDEIQSIICGQAF
jgi:HD-like signal output (HDOD) protein